MGLGKSREELFWAKVDKAGPIPTFRPDLGPCWLWTGAPQTHGYGRFLIGYVDGRRIRMQAHRVAYELLIGSVPDGLEIDHLCRVRMCVNPWHLEPVTAEENRRRGFASELNRVNHQTAKTHCPQGHEYTEANTYVDRKGHRRCRRCHREQVRALAANG